MAKDYDISFADGKASIRTPYNIEFVQRVKLMGGKWDSSARRWVVDERRVEAVRAAMTEVYGRSDLEPGELVKVRVTFDNGYNELCGPITLFGATIASASGRDSGARVGDRVVFCRVSRTAAAAPKTGALLSGAAAGSRYTTCPPITPASAWTSCRSPYMLR